MKAGDEIVRQFDLSSLRHLISVGEPLNPEAVIWSEKVFGLPFHDSYWQTETGSIMISNYPGMKIKPGSMGKPFPGITGAVVDPKTYEPVRRTGRDRPDRLPTRLACHDEDLLEERGDLQGQVQERLVPAGRPGADRQRWLFLVHRAG